MTDCTCKSLDYSGCEAHPYGDMDVFETRMANMLMALLEETKKNNEELKRTNELLEKITLNSHF